MVYLLPLPSLAPLISLHVLFLRLLPQIPCPPISAQSLVPRETDLG